MSTPLHEGMGQESLNPAEFLEAFEATHECFRLSSGIVGGLGETEVVDVANYHAPIADFIDIDTHISHLKASHDSPTIGLPLEITQGFRYAFEADEPHFRVGRGAFLHIMERRVPVRLVTIGLYDRRADEETHFHWLYKDESAPEQN